MSLDISGYGAVHKMMGMPLMFPPTPTRAHQDAQAQQRTAHHVTDDSEISEDGYKAIKLENNFENLNNDICAVADELEQIKQLLFMN